MVKGEVKLCIGLNQIKISKSTKTKRKKLKAQMPEHVPIENMIMLVDGRPFELQEELQTDYEIIKVL